MRREKRVFKSQTEIIIDLTSFFRFNLSRLFTFLKREYPESSAIAFLNETKPEIKLNDERRKSIAEICSRFGINLITSSNSGFAIIDAARRYRDGGPGYSSESESAKKPRIVLVSNSKYLIKTFANIFTPDELRFVVQSSFYHALRNFQGDEFIQTILRSYTFNLFYGLPYALEKTIYGQAKKSPVLSQAKGFFVRKKLNERLLKMLPARTYDLISELEKTYRERALTALCGFLYHNPVAFKNGGKVIELLDPKTRKRKPSWSKKSFPRKRFSSEHFGSILVDLNAE